MIGWIDNLVIHRYILHTAAAIGAIMTMTSLVRHCKFIHYSIIIILPINSLILYAYIL